MRRPHGLHLAHPFTFDLVEKAWKVQASGEIPAVSQNHRCQCIADIANLNQQGRFEWALAHSCLSHFEKDRYATHGEWERMNDCTRCCPAAR